MNELVLLDCFRRHGWHGWGQFGLRTSRTGNEILPKVVNAQILRFGIALLDWKSPAVIRILQTYAVEFIQSNRDVELIKVAREKANASLMELIKSAA